VRGNYVLCAVRISTYYRGGGVAHGMARQKWHCSTANFIYALRQHSEHSGVRCPFGISCPATLTAPTVSTAKQGLPLQRPSGPMTSSPSQNRPVRKPQSTHVTKTGLKQVTPCAIAAARSLMPPAPLLQSMGGWLGVWWCST
jgi:hypothetical protein